MTAARKFWYRAAALVVLLTVLLLIRNSSFKLTEQDIIAGLQQDVSPQGIAYFQLISDTISFVSLPIPIAFLFYGLYRKRKDWWRKGLVILLSVALAGSIGAVIKRTFKEPRPYEVDERIHQYSKGGSNSFPSGHTVEATVAALGWSLILFRGLPWIAAAGWSWAMLIMLSRIVLGVHNFTDIAAGITLGCLGMLIMLRIFAHYGWNLDGSDGRSPG